jgi:hypothetical protein
MRESAGLTQGELGTHLGVDRRTIIRWKSGEFPIGPPVERLLTILADPDWRRFKALAFGERDPDPLADMARTFDQDVADLRALRAGTTPTKIPPARVGMHRGGAPMPRRSTTR